MLVFSQSFRNRYIALYSFVSLAVVGIPPSAWGQDWEKTIGRKGLDAGVTTRVDSKGNVCVLGRAINFVGDRSKQDIVVVKYAADGQEIWQRTPLSTDADDFPMALTLDSSDNLYIVGWSETKINSVKNGIVTAKLSSEEKLLWSNFYNAREERDNNKNGGSDQRGSAVSVDSSGNVYASGYTESRAGGTRTVTSISTLKYSPAGQLLWQQHYDAGGGNPGKSVVEPSYFRADSAGINSVIYQALDSSGNVVVAGTVRFGSNDGYNDFVVMKYSPDGASLWRQK